MFNLMTAGNGLSPFQLSLITGTLLFANLAAFWLIRRNFFKSSSSNSCSGKKKNEILDEKEWNEFELIERKEITHNTAIYRFKLPTSESILPLPIGQVRNKYSTFLLMKILARSIGCYLE